MKKAVVVAIVALALVASLLLSLGAFDGENDPVLVDSAGTLASISFNAPFDDELERPASGEARWVVIRDDLASGIPDLAAIRAANPEAEILLYKDAAFTLWDQEGDGTDASGEPRCPAFPYQGTGVDYCSADPNEDWFLHDAEDPSLRLRSADYDAQWAMDPGNEEYQDAWVESVLARLRDADRDGNTGEGPDDRFDGVFMDDVNVRPGHGLGSQGILGMPPADPAHPDGANPAYRTAMTSFVERVAAGVGEAPEGFVVAANADGDIYDPDDRAALLAVAADLDLYLQERFMRLYADRGPSGEVIVDELHSEPATETASDWSDWIDYMGEVQAAGASWLGLTYGRDATPADIEAQRFVRASFLLGWDGTDGGALAYRSLDNTPGGPLGLEWWTASVGVPEGDMYASEGGGYRRDFSAGTVIVNPDREGTASFDLGGSYELADGSCVEEVVLPPQRAVIAPACG